MKGPFEFCIDRTKRRTRSKPENTRTQEARGGETAPPKASPSPSPLCPVASARSFRLAPTWPISIFRSFTLCRRAHARTQTRPSRLPPSGRFRTPGSAQGCLLLLAQNTARAAHDAPTRTQRRMCRFAQRQRTTTEKKEVRPDEEKWEALEEDGERIGQRQHLPGWRKL